MTKQEKIQAELIKSKNQLAKIVKNDNEDAEMWITIEKNNIARIEQKLKIISMF